MALRISFGLLRTGIHAAFVAMLSISLVLLFVFWSLMQLFDQSQADLN